MASKKKVTTAAVAVATAAVLMLGGTFAWQSISQTALNEASDVINPGGRLHDDFYIDNNGDYNADIYVENFADDEIFARVRLEEYMEVVINYGTDAAIPQTLVGSKNDNYDTNALNIAKDKDGKALYERVYAPYYFDGNEETDGNYNAAVDGEANSWFSWTPGSASSETVYYMPTFNMNKDSLVADRNGMYVDRIGGISNRGAAQYEDYTVYSADQEESGTEIYDVDTNTADEVGYNFENLQTYVDAKNIKIVDATHAAAPVGYTNGLISMSDWLNLLNNGEATDDYWVYDTDGWVYWSSPIAGGATTGLLLDAIELNQVMDDTWYYAINAIGQFVTADDVDGFYNEGEAPSTDAETLLEAIGVTLDGSGNDDFVAQAGTVDSNGGISLSIDSPYINVDGNTITINAGAAYADEEQWYTAPTTLTGTNLLWANLSSRIAYKLNEETGEYDEWGSYTTEDNEDSGSAYPFDVCMGEGLDIYLGSEYAEPGTYKIVGSGTDDEGNEWSGEVVITVDYIAGEGGDEDEEPEDPYGFSHLLLGFNTTDTQYNSTTLMTSGYVQPGDVIPFSAIAYYNDGTLAEITSDNTKWTISAVEGDLAEGTAISESGLLTIAADQTDLTVINVKVSFTDKFNETHTKDQSFLISKEAVTLTLEVEEADTYYTETPYEFEAAATNASGDTVPMAWTYDIVPQDEEAMLDATIDAENNTFTASDAGDYYLRAWAGYMTGQYAQVELTVVEESADTTAPTVSIACNDSPGQVDVTVNGVSDSDFPLTLKAYAQTAEEGTIAEDPYNTITITLTDATPESENESILDMSYDAENGTLTLTYSAVQDGLTYYKDYGNGMSTSYGLKLVIADAAGNEYEMNAFTWTEGGCFVAGTQVQTVNGLVNIEDIQVGDTVYSIDLTTGEKVENPVIWVQGTRYTEATYTIYAGNEEIVTTYEHPFYVFGKEWVAAEDLAVGDVLMDMNGNEVAITKIVYTELDQPIQVYNFQVGGTHNYLITEAGILVHNISK